MAEELLSVIIPAYNLEDYIEECVNSVRNQTYHDLDIIIVDDGSQDNTLDVCRRIAKDDKRVTVLTQENAGVTMARRKGLVHAKSEYITFVDGDDYLEPEMYECMMPYIANCDIVCSGYFHHYSNVRIKQISDDFVGAYKSKNQMEEIWSKMIYDLDKDVLHPVQTGLWSKIYKKELAISVLNKMDSKIFYGEDNAFLYQYLLRCKSAYFIRDAFYHYQCRETSVCHSKNEKMLENVSYLYHELKNAFETHDMRAELMAQLQKKIVVTTLVALNEYMGFSSQYRVPKYVIDVEDLRNKKILIYGASQMGQDVMFQLEKEKIATAAWVDKDYMFLRKQGLEVCSPNIIRDVDFDALLITVSDADLAEQIKVELVTSGVCEEHIIWKKPIKLW